VPPRCVLITGATGAIGGALALEYARAGSQTVILQGRNSARLWALAHACAAHGARVITRVLDVRDAAALRAWLAQVSSAETPDLVIACAGINIHADAGQVLEPWEDVQRLVDVNIRAVLATADGVLPAMRARRKGQIALIGSLAAWRGLPQTPAYCASKAAIKVYGEALRDALADSGVCVSVVLPGYVASTMCAAMPGPKPFVWSPARAARAIRRGLHARRARIGFPWPLYWGCFLLAGLPPWLSARILRWLGHRA